MINEESGTIERVVLKTNFDSLRIVEEIIEKVSEEQRLPEDSFGNVLIAVTEALNNAIIHGNKHDEVKSVVLEVCDSGSTITFSVKDEGDGFDFNNLPDPTAPENIEKPNGRGIFLMKSLADEVIFEDGGSKVNIVFSK